MSEVMELAKRLLDLEIRYAHLERWTDELSRVVAEQGQTIEAHRTEIRRLAERLLSAGVEERANERPPHY